MNQVVVLPAGSWGTTVASSARATSAANSSNTCPEVDRKADGIVMRAAQILADNGFGVDLPLGEKDAAKCLPCTPGSNCH
ncbi:hypothetical protein AB5J56_00705 [Streptomyces sp. R21]|uniref:Uncharacterized protein n=1 Tax=Streptomyces sp. R21 TaxID=3238627 RepID=A0AB39NZQ3_9ACTN